MAFRSSESVANSAGLRSSELTGALEGGHTNEERRRGSCEQVTAHCNGAAPPRSTHTQPHERSPEVDPVTRALAAWRIPCGHGVEHLAGIKPVRGRTAAVAARGGAQRRSSPAKRRQRSRTPSRWSKEPQRLQGGRSRGEGDGRRRLARTGGAGTRRSGRCPQPAGGGRAGEEAAVAGDAAGGEGGARGRTRGGRRRGSTAGWKAAAGTAVRRTEGNGGRSGLLACGVVRFR